jgi:hypothetical protein
MLVFEGSAFSVLSPPKHFLRRLPPFFWCQRSLKLFVGMAAYRFGQGTELGAHPPSELLTEAMMVIATRVLKLKSDNGDVAIPIRVFAPKQEDNAGLVPMPERLPEGTQDTKASGWIRCRPSSLP